jgi:glycosyltransferase involved in cell wall biosynthesis
VRVAFDMGIPAVRPTGVSRYVAELAAALTPLEVELRPFIVSFRARDVNPAFVHVRVPARLVQLAWRAVGHPTVERLVGQVDLVHGTNFVLPPARAAKGVVTIHDVAFRRSDGHVRSPRLAALAPWSVRNADAVVVPTQTIADEVVDVYGARPDRTVVTYEGVAPSWFEARPLEDKDLERLGISRPFTMALGTIQPRKNLRRLVDAWTATASSLPEWTLVLAGPAGWGPKLPTAPNIVQTGWMDNEFLHGLFGAAEFFCYPSLYEGFGLPPLEAMAAGTPCLLGDYGAARELFAETALLVNRLDTDAIAEGLLRLANDEALRSKLISAGRARAREFTWERVARATIRAYEIALEA